MKIQKNKQDTTLHLLRELLSPTGLESLIFIILGVFAALSAKIFTLIDKSPITAFNAANARHITTNLEKRLSGLSAPPAPTTALLWFAVGCVVYILGWILVIIVIDSYNNVIISYAFIHPDSFHQSQYWTAIIGRALLRIAAGIILLFGLLITLTSLVPYIYDRSFNVIGGATVSVRANSIFWIVFSTFGTLLIATILLRLLFLRRRLF